MGGERGAEAVMFFSVGWEGQERKGKTPYRAMKGLWHYKKKIQAVVDVARVILLCMCLFGKSLI